MRYELQVQGDGWSACRATIVAFSDQNKTEGERNSQLSLLIELLVLPFFLLRANMGQFIDSSEHINIALSIECLSTILK